MSWKLASTDAVEGSGDGLKGPDEGLKDPEDGMKDPEDEMKDPDDNKDVHDPIEAEAIVLESSLIEASVLTTEQGQQGKL